MGYGVFELPRQAIAKAVGPLFPVLGGGAHITQKPSAGHMGLDIGAKAGTPVVAPVSGKISRIQEKSTGYGTAVWMIDPATGKELTFGHLLREFVKVGQNVVAGEEIGQVGSTGMSTGPHLHFEVGEPGAQPFHGKKTEEGAVDPLAWLKGAAPLPGLGLPALGTVKTKTTTPAPIYSVPTAAATSGATASTATKPLVSVGIKGLGSIGIANPATAATTSGAVSSILSPGALDPTVKGSLAAKGVTLVKNASLIYGGALLMVVGVILFALSFREVQGAAKGAIGAAVGGPVGAVAAVS